MSYGYHKPYTIDHTKVGSGGVSSYPALVALTDSALATVANGGRVTSSSGFDIIVTSDAAGTTKLDHEIEQYVAATGQIAFWVRVPSVSDTADTVVYIQYGDSTVTTSQENKTGVWDANFKAVYHFGDGTTLSLADSTSNARTLTNHGATAAAGNIGPGAASMASASSQYMALGTLTGLGSGDRTFSCWFNPATLTSTNSRPFCFPADDTSTDHPSGAVGLKSGASASNVQVTGSPANVLWFTAATLAWAYIVVIASGTNLLAYLNGVSLGSNADTGSNTANPLGYLGRYNANYGQYYDGLLDEMRVSGAARSAAWITTEYNNQSSPSTFATLGSEVSNSSPIAATGTAGEGEGVAGSATLSEAATATAGEGQGVTGTASASEFATGAAGEGEGLAGSATVSESATGSAGEGQGVSGSATLSEAATGSAGEGQGVAGAATESIAASGSAGEGEGVAGTATASESATGTAGEGEGVVGFTGTAPDAATGTAGEGEGIAGSATSSESGTAAAGEGEGVSGTATLSESATGAAGEGQSVAGAATEQLAATGTAGEAQSVTGTATSTTPGAPTPLKATRVYAGPLIRATRVYAGPLIRATRVYAGPLVRATRVETFPS